MLSISAFMFGLTQIASYIPAPFSEYFIFAVILGVAFLAARIAGRLMVIFEHRIAKRSKTNLDDIMLEHVKGPIQVGIMLAGLYLSHEHFPLLAPLTEQVNIAYSILIPFYVAYFISRVVGGLIDWYGVDVASKTESKLDDQFLPIIKKATYGAIFLITILVMLSQLGIRVETVIAAMGLGGLAVALAPQPTLANFFSGVHMVLDRPVKIGDFIELDTGDRGTVVDIGWRSTKIRTFTNTTVVLPNSKLADSKVINYDSPDSQFGFYVECGVSYDSNLEEVEKVALQTAKDVMKKCNGIPDFEPVVRFREFGPSSINFRVTMRNKTLGDTYLAKHEFIKEIKRRFEKEGITMPFPQMDVHMECGGVTGKTAAKMTGKRAERKADKPAGRAAHRANARKARKR
ncbi:MAG: mechanosensitive ion channel family protein [Candidatus Aenigmatarchaeota archaeon]